MAMKGVLQAISEYHHDYGKDAESPELIASNVPLHTAPSKVWSKSRAPGEVSDICNSGEVTADCIAGEEESKWRNSLITSLSLSNGEI